MKDPRNMYLIQLILPLIWGLNARSFTLDEAIKLHRPELNFDGILLKTRIR